MIRRSRLIIAAILLIMAVAVIAASLPLVQQMLPGNNTVKGFTILKDSLVYGKGNDLTKIYDGGYELYTKNGVIDAARQMYQRKNDYVEVTIHTMKSDKAALDFLKYWQKEHKVKSLTKSKASASFMITKPNVMMYGVTGKYFTTVTTYSSTDSAKGDVKSFFSVIEKRIAGMSKSSKK